MTLQIRRVVTGHDAQGRAVVLFDGPCRRTQARRPGHAARVVWTTTSPADNTGEADAAEGDFAASIVNGSVFQIVEYAPGVAPRRHRTSTIDYGVVLSGEIDMRLDDAEVYLLAGYVFVQRGTIHDWINRGSGPCVIAFVLIAAAPVTAGGQILAATG